MDVDAGTSTELIEQVSEMGAPESMKLYAVMLNVLPQGTTIATNDTINSGAATASGKQVWVSGYPFMDLNIFVGNNRIPHRPFDISTIDATTSKELVLPTPIYVEWSQKLYIKVQNNDPTTPNDDPGTAPGDWGTVSSVEVLLIGEVVDEVEMRRRLERQKQAAQAAQAAAQQKSAPKQR